MVARLSDLDYTRLYGRYRVCTTCGEDFTELLDTCPTCRSPDSTLVDRTGRLPAMLTLTYPGDWLTVALCTPGEPALRPKARRRDEMTTNPPARTRPHPTSTAPGARLQRSHAL